MKKRNFYFNQLLDRLLVMTITKNPAGCGVFDAYWGGWIKKKPGDDLLSRDSSTIGAEELNFRVRDGNGWDLFAMITRRLITK